MNNIQHLDNDIVENFALQGYSATNTFQKNKHTYIGFICPRGHEHQIRLDYWKKGGRCAKCVGSYRPLRSAKKIQEEFTSEGFTLLEEYKKDSAPMDFLCPFGHKHKITYSKWIQGKRCFTCQKERNNKSSLQKEGYSTPETIYNCEQYFLVTCPNNHSYKTTWTNWNRGRRCNFCKGTRINLEIAKESFASEGYQLLDDEYKNSSTHLNYLCSQGHRHKITWRDWGSGYRCPYCAHNTMSHEVAEKSFSSKGYLLLSPQYINSDTPLLFLCNNGHKHSITWRNWNSGNRCAICSGRYKKTEEEERIKAISSSIVTSVNKSLVRQKIKKNFSAHKFADRIAAQIYQHLGDRPENHHLDHIIPRCFFDHLNQHEIDACWDVHNLQWLPAVENLKKNKKLSPKDIAKFTEKQLDILRIASRKPRSLEKYIPRKKMYAEQLKLFT